jgi:hypothetical protein
MDSFMEKVQENMRSITIETTIGDLICAIREAAQESSIQDAELAKLTHLILMDILSRKR